MMGFSCYLLLFVVVCCFVVDLLLLYGKGNWLLFLGNGILESGIWSYRILSIESPGDRTLYFHVDLSSPDYLSDGPQQRARKEQS